MVHYQKLLTFSLIPVVLLTLLAFISIILTAHYSILADFVVGRWLRRRSTFPERNRFQWDDVIIDYAEGSTNAMIASGCLCLAAGVNAIIAFIKLKPRTMDLDYHLPLRRFWVGSAIGMTLAGLCAALAALITSFTNNGPDEYGCTKTTGRTKDGGVPFTNMMCSRENAMCKFVGPVYDKAGFIPNIQRWAVTIACNEAVVAKWLQVVLALNAAIVIAMFAMQARVRRRARSSAWRGL